MKKEKTENPNKIGVAKFWGWQGRAVSLGCMTIVYGYYMIFCTDTLMLNSAVVGMLMLASKVLDGITDLIAGYLIDNTNTRFGRARPYEFCIIGVWLCTWMLFSCPDSWSAVVKYIWVTVLYIFVNSIFSTFLNCNQTTYMARAFPNMGQMVKLNSYGGIVVTLGCAIVSMTFPTLMANLATSSAGWSALVGIYALPLALIGMLRFLLVKETVEVKNEQGNSLSLKDMLTVLKSNKHIYFVFGVFLLYNITLGLNAYSYYFTYVVGDISQYTMIASVSMPLMLVMFAFPAMMKKMRLSRLVMLGAASGTLGYILVFFSNGNIALLMLAAALFGFGGYPIAYVGGMMILDCAEFNSLNGLPRAEGTMSAFQSCASKIGQGVGSALLGVILSAGGFNAALDVQPNSAIFTIRCLYSVIPAIMFALMFIILHFYKLDRDLPALREQAKAAQETN